MLQALRHSIANITPAATPAAIPAGYLTLADHLSDPAKAIGIVVLLLQGVYVLIKIVKEIKGRKNAVAE